MYGVTALVAAFALATATSASALRLVFAPFASSFAHSRRIGSGRGKKGRQRSPGRHTRFLDEVLDVFRCRGFRVVASGVIKSSWKRIPRAKLFRGSVIPQECHLAGAT